ncbi:MAG: glycosyl hydrolase [Puniceicoccaceae bacterium]
MRLTPPVVAFRKFVPTGLLWLSLTLVGFSGTNDQLESGFLNPPDSAKPLTWWHWLNGSVTEEGITADLESMKRIGLGGAIMFNSSGNIPQGTARFMGPEWLAMVDHTMKECSRLGLEFGLHNCDGFSQSGGPWITPEMSMKKLTWSVQEVVGPIRIDEQLKKPTAWKDFYHDITVVAFPVPQGESLTGQGSDTVLSGSIRKEELAYLIDGDPETVANFPSSKDGHVVNFEFSTTSTVRSLRCLPIKPIRGMSVFPIKMEVSTDGINFRKVGAFSSDWNINVGDQITASCEGATGKIFRLTFETSDELSFAEIELSETARIHFGESKAARMQKRGHGADRVYYDNFPGPDRRRVLPSELTIARGAIKDISSKMSTDGHLKWDVPKGKWRIMRVGYTSTGRMNAPATPEGKGLESDKLDAKAVRFHLEQYVTKLLDRPLSQSFEVLQTDSWHADVQDWTDGFEKRFKDQVGYDILEFIPTLLEGWIIDNVDVSERVLWDWRRFLSDQFSANYFETVHNYAKEKGLTYISENTGKVQFLYDIAAARHGDIPMGEFWGTSGDGVRVDNKVASSIAHITGKPIVASESYTSGEDAALWNNHPFSLKALGDEAFCAGVNQFIFHTFAHQPYQVTGPGFTFKKWGMNFNRANTWWEPGRAWMDYLTRCNYMLRAGISSCDVLFYVGDDVPNYIGWRDELHPALPAGYDYDGCDSAAIMEASVEKGEIVLPSGTRYRVLLLPNLPTMRPAVLRKIKVLVDAGAVVLGPRPKQSPSLQDFGVGDKELQELAEELWGGTNPDIYSKISFEELFKRIDLPPDFEFEEEVDVLYIHRSTGDAEIYFLSNQEDHSVELNASFRAGNHAPELWDPATGEIRLLPDFNIEEDVVHLPLRLDPYGSTFVVFRGNRKPSNGKNWLEMETVQTIGGPWGVNFPPNLGAPDKAMFDELDSWTDNPDPGIRFFSGTAIYQTSFEYQNPQQVADVQKPAQYLDLGNVAVIAEVELNGKNLGVLWKPPFRVPIDSALREGKNTLVVKVTNLWRNRMIGDEKIPEDDIPPRFPRKWPDWLLQGKPRPSGRVTYNTHPDGYNAKDPLYQSGLLGPVTIAEEH